MSWRRINESRFGWLLILTTLAVFIGLSLAANLIPDDVTDWQRDSIGSPATATVDHSGAPLVLTTDATGVAGTADQVLFYSKSGVVGDEVRSRITNITGPTEAMAGVMARIDSTNGAATVFLGERDGVVVVRHRDAAGEDVFETTYPSIPVDGIYSLIVGDGVIYASYSQDGLKWEPVTGDTIAGFPFPSSANVRLGVAASSGQSGTSASASFESVVVSGPAYALEMTHAGVANQRRYEIPTVSPGNHEVYVKVDSGSTTAVDLDFEFGLSGSTQNFPINYKFDDYNWVRIGSVDATMAGEVIVVDIDPADTFPTLSVSSIKLLRRPSYQPAEWVQKIKMETGVDAAGDSTIQKVQTSAWDGGARTLRSIENEGGFAWKLDRVNGNALVGLTTNPNAGAAYNNTIDYRMYFLPYTSTQGKIIIYSGAAIIANNIFFDVDDVFAIERIQGKIWFLQNGAPIANVTDANEDRLYGHTIIFTKDLQLLNPSIRGAGIEGDLDEDGMLDSFEQSIVDGDSTITSIYAVLPNSDEDDDGVTNYQEYLDGSDPLEGRDKRVSRSVVWTDFVFTDVIDSNDPSALERTVGSAAYNADAISELGIPGNGLIEWEISQTDKILLIGLGVRNDNRGFADMEYSIQFTNYGTIAVYESGALKYSDNNGYTVDEKFSIQKINQTVFYLRDGNVFYTSARASVDEALYADSSFYHLGGKIDSVVYRGAVNVGDVDGDEMADLFEQKIIDHYTHINSIYDVSPTAAFGPNSDPDGDGYSNEDEYLYGSDPTDFDDNRDWKPIEWENLTNMTATPGTPGSQLEKTFGGNAHNAEGLSKRILPGNGVLEWVVPQTDKIVSVGLNLSNDHMVYSDSEYSIYVSNAAVNNVQIFESGVLKATIADYDAGDKFEIRRVDGVVTYYQEDQVIYQSSRVSAAGESFMVDASFFHLNGKISDARWRGAITEGDIDEDGMADSYEQIIVDHYANITSIHEVDPTGDPGSNGDPDGDGDSNEDEYLYGSDPTDFYDNRDWKPIEWKNLTNMAATPGTPGSQLEKTFGGNAHNAEGLSKRILPGNGVLEWVVPQTDKIVSVGLNLSNDHMVYSDSEYSIYVSNAAVNNVQIFEGGILKATIADYDAGDKFEIRRVDGVVTYYQEDQVIYQSSRVSAVGESFMVDASFFHLNGKISDARWRGAIIEGDIDEDEMADSYEQAIVDSVGDPAMVSFHQYKPDDNLDGDPLTNLQEYLYGSDPTNEYEYHVAHAVDWKDLVNTQETPGDPGSELEKSAGGYAYNSDGVSVRILEGNGALKWKYGSTSQMVWVGLGTSNDNRSYSDIEYSIVNLTGTQLYIYEGAAIKKIITGYTTDDFIEIRRLGGWVHFYQNENHIYTSSRQSVDEDLMVDTSFYHPGAKITDAEWQGSVTIGDVDEDGLPDDFEDSLLAAAISSGEFEGLTHIRQITPDTDLVGDDFNNGDLDGDNVSNYHEYLDGTNLLNKNDYFLPIEWEQQLRVDVSNVGENGRWSKIARSTTANIGESSGGVSKHVLREDGRLRFEFDATDIPSKIGFSRYIDGIPGGDMALWVELTSTPGVVEIWREGDTDPVATSTAEENKAFEVRLNYGSDTFTVLKDVLGTSPESLVADHPIGSDFDEFDLVVVADLPETNGAITNGRYRSIRDADGDGDGLPDAFEENLIILAGLVDLTDISQITKDTDLAGDSFDNGDLDGDGVSNFAEFIEGTDLLDLNDYFVPIDWDPQLQVDVSNVGEGNQWSRIARTVSTPVGDDSGGVSSHVFAADGVLRFNFEDIEVTSRIGIVPYLDGAPAGDMTVWVELNSVTGEAEVWRDGNSTALISAPVTPEETLEIRLNLASDTFSVLRDVLSFDPIPLVLDESLQADFGEFELVVVADLPETGSAITNGRYRSIKKADSDGDGLPDIFEESLIALAGIADLTHISQITKDTDLAGDSFDNGDLDGDGVSNVAEFLAGTSAINPDTDGDELEDGDEVLVHSTDPLNPDSDGDGLSDGEEVLTYGTDPTELHSDADTLTDGAEVLLYGTDPLDEDSDNDGINDDDEVNIHKTDPRKPDTDGDGLKDGWEVTHSAFGLDPLVGNDPNADWDGDHVTNKQEHDAGLNPNSPMVVATIGGMHALPPVVDAGLYQIDATRDGLSLDGVDVGAPNNFSVTEVIGVSRDSSALVRVDDGSTWLWRDSTWSQPTIDGGAFTMMHLNENGDLVGVASTPPTLHWMRDSNVLNLNTTDVIDAQTNERGQVVMLRQVTDGGGSIVRVETASINRPNESTQILELSEEVSSVRSISELTLGGHPSGAIENHGFADTSGVLYQHMPDSIGGAWSRYEISASGYLILNGEGDDGQGVLTTIESVWKLGGDSNDNGMSDDWEAYWGLDPANNPLDAPGADRDGDTLSNFEEFVYRTNPKKKDTDGDGVEDQEEIETHGSNPLLEDSDFDRISDFDEISAGSDFGLIKIDSDGDGLSDDEEILLGSDPNDADSDNDGQSDGFESQNGGDPLDENVWVRDRNLDTDGDRLSDWQEWYAGTKINVADTDGDGLSDGAEVLPPIPVPPLYETLPGLGLHPLVADTDGDGYRDGSEIFSGSDATDASSIPSDADQDGLTDLEEFAIGTDPNLDDTDWDGLPDGLEVVNNPSYGDLDPLVANSLDYDNDSYPNEDEINNGTDPLNYDDGVYEMVEFSRPAIRTWWELDPITNLPIPGSEYEDAEDMPAYFIQGFTDPNSNDTDGDFIPDDIELELSYIEEDTVTPEIKHIRIPFNPSAGDNEPTDIDGDGIPNGIEYLLGSDMFSNDSDTDGIPDGEEEATDLLSTNALDENSDGIPDGLLQLLMFRAGTSNWTANDDEEPDHLALYAEWRATTDWNDDDWDNDGLLDGEEIWIYQTDPKSRDTDNDNVEDKTEIIGETNPFVAEGLPPQIDPLAPDTDDDGIPDSVELLYELNPNSATDGNEDLDGDDLSNFIEYRLGTYLNDLHIDTDDDGVADTWKIGKDSDGDEMDDYWEVIHGLNPLHRGDAFGDRDGDGVFNIDEWRSGSNPTLADSDRDGMPDEWELLYPAILDPNDPLDAYDHDDTDGLTNAEEYAHGTEPDDEDSDADGMWDKWEIDHNLDPLDLTDANDHNDADTLTNLEEFNLNPPTNPNLADTDGDLMTDDFEVFGGLQPTIDDADLNPDNDGLTNLQEFQYSPTQPWLNPNDADTDKDGMPDGWELSWTPPTNGQFPALDPLDIADGPLHYDGDSLSNFDEYDLGFNPYLSDTDGDGVNDNEEITDGALNNDSDDIPDVWEIAYGLNRLVDDGAEDPDRDGKTNSQEYADQTDPNSAPLYQVELIAMGAHGATLDAQGNVTGLVRQPDGSLHHFTWAQGQQLQIGDDSGTTIVPLPVELDASLLPIRGLGTLGGLSSTAHASNDHVAPEFTGMSDPADGEPRAFVWRNREIFDLNAAIPAHTGWFLSRGVAINDTGEILAWGYKNGQAGSVLLSPIIDTDGDGLPDEWELLYTAILDPNEQTAVWPVPAELTTDATSDDENAGVGDGLNNLLEYHYGADPTNDDSDDDQIPDGWEHRHGLDPMDNSDAALDFDGDAQSNLAEFNDSNAPNPQGDYEIQKLLDLGVGAHEIIAVNDWGDVLGSSDDIGPWILPSGVNARTQLADLSGNSLEPRAIDNLGEIAGAAGDKPFTTYGQAPVPISLPNNIASGAATDLSNSGYVALSLSTDAGGYQAGRYDLNTLSLTTINLAADTASIGSVHIAENGDLAILSQSNSGAINLVIHSVDASIQTIDLSVSQFSNLADISVSGFAATGLYFDAIDADGGVTHHRFESATSSLIDFTVDHPRLPGRALFTQTGQIHHAIGSSSLGEFLRKRVPTTNGVIEVVTPLESLLPNVEPQPWADLSADAINDIGTIVGIGYENGQAAIYRLRDPDIDKDGLPDEWELEHFGDITSQDGDGDPDGDDISNADEYANGTDPNKNNVGIGNPDGDPDHDGLLNRDEDLLNRNPEWQDHPDVMLKLF